MPNVAEAYIGDKATLSYWSTTSSPPGWARYAEIRSMGELGVMKNEVDKTTLDSDAVERRGGLADPEKFSFQVNMTASQFTILKAQIDADDNLDYKVDYAPTGLNMDLYFAFAPLGYKVGKVTPKDIIELTIEGRISGDISETTSHP